MVQEKVARLESTREALQAQIAGDYTRAWQCYDKALNEMDEMDQGDDTCPHLWIKKITVSCRH